MFLLGGGDKRLESKKLEWKASSRIGSLENMRHKPGGGQIKIFNERYSGRSFSEVRKPRQPSAVRSTSPTSARLNAKLNGKIENNNSISSANSNVDQKQANNEHTSRTASRINSGLVNGMQQKQTNDTKLINDLKNLSINKPTQINNAQLKPVPTDLLS